MSTNIRQRLAILRKTGDSDVLWLLDYANDLALSLDASRSTYNALAQLVRDGETDAQKADRARIAALEEALRRVAEHADYPTTIDAGPFDEKRYADLLLHIGIIAAEALAKAPDTAAAKVKDAD